MGNKKNDNIKVAISCLKGLKRKTKDREQLKKINSKITELESYL